jgi:hypothetical protein
MLLDAQTLFSKAQTLATTAGTLTSTNAIDLGAAGVNSLGGTHLQDIGRSPGVKVFCQVDETVTSGGAATINFQLIQSAAANLGSPDVLASSGVIALGSLAAGYRPPGLSITPGLITKRYIGMQYVVATATTTAGAVTSGLVLDIPTNAM